MNGTTLNTQNEYQIHQNEISLHELGGFLQLLISLGYKLEKTSCAMHQHEGIKIELLLSHPIEKPRYLLAPLVPCFLSSIIMSNVAGIN